MSKKSTKIVRNVSKKTRFEVFKRDKFICQYCGQSAPNVVLEIDHIEPKSKGGKNDIMNLITSCYECNRGKSDKKLDDDSVISKQKLQLELLQKRREQIQLMFEWKNGLCEIDNQTVGMIQKYLENKIMPYTLSSHGLSQLSALPKKYKVADILEAIDISVNTYLRHDKNNNLIQESVNNCIEKIGGILFNQNKTPIEKAISYIKGYCRNTFNYWDAKKGAIYLSEYVKALSDYGWSKDSILKDLENELLEKTKECKNWSEWRGLLEGWIKSVKSWEKETEEKDYQYTKADVIEAIEGMAHDRNEFIDILEYLAKPFESFDITKIGQLIDTIIYSYLFQYHQYFDPEVKEKSFPRVAQAFYTAQEIINSSFKPTDMFTFNLERVIVNFLINELQDNEWAESKKLTPEDFSQAIRKYKKLIK